MNLMVYRWGTDCLVVDAGMMFPGAEHLGVEVVIPDLSFLDDCGTIHAVILTHGHEDHIGALSYLLGRHDVPVHATAYTTGLIRHRLGEHGMLEQARLKPLPAGERLEFGPFQLETVVAAHSIPEARMVVLHTPVGTIVHTADFKLDPNPVDGAGTDLARLAELGRSGVLALLSDSTNADCPGFTPAEASVKPAFDRLLAGQRGRVVVGMFSSHVHRLQMLANLARNHRRRLAIVGTSLRTHVEVAETAGLLEIPAGLRVASEDVMDLPPDEVLVLASGSQGEPMSALARIAVDRHRDVQLSEGDLFIHSARRIPATRRASDA